MLPSLGIYLFENGTTLAIESTWKGTEEFAFFAETDLGKFHTKELTLPCVVIGNHCKQESNMHFLHIALLQHPSFITELFALLAFSRGAESIGRNGTVPQPAVNRQHTH